VGSDDPTSRFYAENAQAYADYWPTPSGRSLEVFLSRLKPQAEILELGCGNGRDSGLMIERGFRVTPTDGTAPMAEQARRRLGVDVAVLRFEDIENIESFDGIWASACLLHVPRPELGDILARIHRALRPQGVFYASYKSGNAEGADRLGRYYNYPDRRWLELTYGQQPWASLEITEHSGGGYDGSTGQWLHATAIKS
jgi:SAM-dependent methyltransferase